MVKLNLQLMPSMKKLEDFTKKPWLVSNLAGAYSSMVQGGGKEVDGFAVYSPEMDSKYIDWVASARSDKILMRTFLDERTTDCAVVVDSSSSMFYSSTNVLKCEYAAEVANSLLFSIISSNDYARLIMSSENVYYDSMAKNSLRHYFNCIVSLMKSENYGGQFNIKHVLSNLVKEKFEGAIFLISDFLNFTPLELELLKILKQKNEVFVFIIRDRMERYMPKNVHSVCVEDIHTGKSILVDIQQVREEYERVMKRNEEDLQQEFLQCDIHTLFLYTYQPFDTQLYSFFKLRGKAWN